MTAPLAQEIRSLRPSTGGGDDYPRAAITPRAAYPKTSPSPQHPEQAVAEIVEDLGFEMLAETADLIESIAISTREAAFRRDLAEIRLRLRHLRLAVNEAMQTYREMNGAGNAP